MNDILTVMVNNGIGVVCAASVLVFAWYRETKTIPELMRTFADAQKVVHDSFNFRNEKALDTFAGLVREERQVYQQWHEENRDRHDENRDRLEKILAEIKEGRHMTRDLAHQLGLRQAVDDQQIKSHGLPFGRRVSDKQEQDG